MTLSPYSNIKLRAMKRWFWFEIFAILILFAWLLGQLSLLGWISDLASHFQVQYFLAFILLLISALWLRKWRWLLFVLLGLTFTCIAIAPYLAFIPHQQSQDKHSVLRIMQANVLFKNHDYSRVIAAIQKYNPDILSIQEVDQTWLSALKPVLKKYPYHIERVKKGRIYGVALYSKLPLRNAAIHYYPCVGRPNLFADIQWQGQTISVVAMHPYSPGRPQKYHWRNQQLLGFAKDRFSFHRHLILIGDLNNTPFSPSFKQLLRQSHLKDTRIGQGVFPTWPVTLPFMWIPIDHVLVSPEFKVESFHGGPYTGSDHYPIVVDLSLKAKP